MSGICRLGAPLIATVILAGGTAVGIASNTEPSERIETTRPESEPPARDYVRPSPSLRVVSTGTCGASFYGEPQGTASGEAFDPDALTAAHKSLPFNTRVRVTNPANGRSVTVRVNDRGPYVDGRCLDLSQAAFGAIANLKTGVLRAVNYEVLG